MARSLTLGWLYPTLMSTYGDRGNVTCLAQRCRWRGIDVEILPLDRDAPPDAFRRADIVVGGGAQDRQQEIAMRDLRGAKGDALAAAIADGVPGVFTCGSPQLLGRYYEPGLGERIEGLGVLDLVTVHPGPDAPRCIGNLVVELTAEPLASDLRSRLGTVPYLLGFENHGGRTRLGATQPLGRVVKGFGNDGTDGTEGAFQGCAIATYSHGPLLPKNPFLADWSIEKALERRGADPTLEPLDDRLAAQARSALFARWGIAEPAIA